MARILDMHEKWMEKPAYRKEYEALAEEFALAAAVIDERNAKTRSDNGSREQGR
jgi:hypothetical protein